MVGYIVHGIATTLKHTIYVSGSSKIQILMIFIESRAN